MRTLVKRSLAVLVLLLASGCAAPPEFARVASSLPPVPAGDARIYVYRILEPYETLSWTELYLNGVPAGVTEPGSVLYRDVAPGTYAISVFSEGTFQNQFKTVALGTGDVAYVRVESLRSWAFCREGLTGCYDTFTVNVVSPAVGRAEIQSLGFIRG